MTRLLAIKLIGLVVLSACAAGPVAPDWQVNAHFAMAGYSRAHLTGQDRLAAQELAAARNAVRRTGDVSLMGRVELGACAARIASLSASACPEFEPLAAHVDDRMRSYFAYLSNRLNERDIDLLPPTQQSIARKQDVLATLAAIAEPDSRLLGCALLLHQGRLPPAGIALAIDTASSQGWQRAVLAWLGIERDRLSGAGDDAGSKHVQTRINLMLNH